MVKHTQTNQRRQPTNCLSVLDHFVGLAFKGLTTSGVFIADFEYVIGSWTHLMLVLHKLDDDRFSFRATCIVRILIVAKMKCFFFIIIFMRVFSIPLGTDSKLNSFQFLF